jgi:hypothetical protein
VEGAVSVQPDPAAPAVSVHVDPPLGGPQTATGSAGTVQAGGGGSQTVTGSAGSVQANVPGTNAGAGASPSGQSGSFSAGVDPATGGPQSAAGSVGTAQVGGGSQTASDSIGTAQVSQPGLEADGSFEGPLRPDMPDGRPVAPEAELGASVDPSAGGPQTAGNSVGTLQIGGGEQTAGDSVATGQIAIPATDADASAGGDDPTLASASTNVAPASGGRQLAHGSAGTVQVGDGGDQTARDSAGTSQVATPGLSSDASVNQDDPSGGSSVGITPAGGNQLADGSAGTVQVGGNGDQTATGSVGTGQVALPGVNADQDGSDVAAGVTPGGGEQTAEDSIGTVQIGGGRGRTTAGVGATPTSGGVLGASVTSAPAATAAQPGAAAGAPARPTRSTGTFGVQDEVKTLTGTLPFTGLSLLAIALAGLALLVAGLLVRRRATGTAAL